MLLHDLRRSNYCIIITPRYKHQAVFSQSPTVAPQLSPPFSNADRVIRLRVGSWLTRRLFFSSPNYLSDIDRDKSKIDILKPHLVGLEPSRPPSRYYAETDEDRAMQEMTLDGDTTIFTRCSCNACGKARPKTDSSGYGNFAAYAYLTPPNDDPPNEEEFFLFAQLQDRCVCS